MKDVARQQYIVEEEEQPLVQQNPPNRLANVAATSELQSLVDPSHSQRTTNFGTLMHLLKGNIGTGILAMPKAISNAGLLVGTLGIPILGIICVHCMHLLVISSKTLARRLGVEFLDYTNTAEQAFRLGPARVQKFAPVARFAVNMMLMLTQFGFCCVYFLFASRSLHEIVTNLHGSSPIPIKGYTAILLLPMILYSLIRNLENLSPFSTFANILQSLGLIFVFYFLLTGHHSHTVLPYTAPINKLPLYFGTAMYAFEGIGVVLPLENEMLTPAAFGGLNGVLNTGMVVVASLYTAVGFFGYLRYGASVEDSITFSLPKTTASELIRLMFAIAIFLSYALQFHVPLKIIWPYLKEKVGRIRSSNLKDQLIMEYILRAVLVIVTFVFAVAIPNLDLLISLVGAFASSSLALIFPPIIELCVVWNTNISRTKLYLIILKNAFIMVFGIFGCVIGTYTVILEIIKKVF